VEVLGEARLVSEFAGDLRADLLKVPHHGSETSSGPEFLDHVRPGVAFVCTGVRNRFGHPRPLVLQRYAQAGVQLVRTDLAGSVSWGTDGERTWLRSMRGALGGPGS
jgi:competence protein ComEC